MGILGENQNQIFRMISSFIMERDKINAWRGGAPKIQDLMWYRNDVLLLISGNLKKEGIVGQYDESAKDDGGGEIEI